MRIVLSVKEAVVHFKALGNFLWLNQHIGDVFGYVFCFHGLVIVRLM
jgi:hypothetical protein